MSYEDKIRDLMARLVSMSPEPPDFPEEAPMASQPTRSRPRPALVFAAAVLAVALLAVPVILLTSGNGQVAVDSTTTSTSAPETTTSVPVTSTTVPAATTTTAEPATTLPPASIWSGTVFLFQTPQDSFLGNPALIPVTLELSDLSGGLAPDAYFTDALALLGPELPELPANAQLDNAIPGDVRIVELATTTIDGADVWQADMSEAFLAGAGGLLADYTMLNQLIYTITDDEIGSVLFTVGGERVTVFGSEGLDLSEPVSRESFQDQLAPIYLTEPLIQQDGSYQVVGIANTFEASLVVGVVDENGESVFETPVQATCGTGCWGEFTAEVPADVIEPGASSITVFEYSAEDGSPINVVTVPIPAGDVWAITVGD